MSTPSICPTTRLRCANAEMCWLLFCAKGGLRMRPIPERELSQAEKYALAMSEKPTLEDERDDR